MEDATLGVVLDVIRLIRALRERRERSHEVLALVARLERRIGLSQPEIPA